MVLTDVDLDSTASRKAPNCSAADRTFCMLSMAREPWARVGPPPLVDGARASNSGLIVDLWPYMRRGRTDDLLGSIPSSKLYDDTAVLPTGMSLMEDCLN